MRSPRELAPLDGSERFSAGELSVLDFWRWALGDLRMNTARGLLAEFLVARAVGATAPVRIEWAAQDVISPDGARVEVKSSGYFQSWGQATPTVPVFRLQGAKQSWDPESGKYLDDPRGRVDVWVFALQNCRDRDTYDPLEINQWSFWVLPDAAVTQLQQKTARLSTIRCLAGEPVAWHALAAAIEVASETQTSPALE